MDRFRLIMDETYDYGDFIVGKVKESLWLYLTSTKTATECKRIKISNMFDVNIAQIIEKKSVNEIMFNGLGESIDDFADYCMLNAKEISSYNYVKHIYTESEQSEESIPVAISRKKLWSKDYVLAKLGGWQGLWDSSNNNWYMLSDKLHIEIIHDDFEGTDLDYIALTEKHITDKVTVITKGFKRLNCNRGGMVHRAYECLWEFKTYKSYTLLKVNGESITELMHILEGETNKVNGINIENESIEKGLCTILDSNNHIILTKKHRLVEQHVIIVLEDYRDRIFVEKDGIIYEIDTRTKRDDTLKETGMKRNGVNIVYGDKIYTAIFLQCRMLYGLKEKSYE